MNTLKLSDLETVLEQNKDFIILHSHYSSIDYIEVNIPGDKNLHFWFNYDSLIYKGEFCPAQINFESFGNLLCAFSFYFTEMHALQGRTEPEKVWRYYECWGGFQALEFALIQLGMPDVDIQAWKLRLKK